MLILQRFWERFQNGTQEFTPTDYICFGVFILAAFEILNSLVLNGGLWLHLKHIPVRGKHLDNLSMTDVAFVNFNRAATIPFIYLFFQYALVERNILWETNELSLRTVIFPLPALYIIYDFFYTILHWALHIKAIYGYIHKHHHHQKAPSRASVDAVNVHPIEFFLGEYNHVLAMFLCCRLMKLHILCGVLFLAIGGCLAAFNHTRYDFVISVFGWKLYDSKAHDVHHRIPQSNYGQYIMLWDWIFGSFRPYDEKDRVNPLAQLDPKTGKSLDSAKSK